MMASSGLRGEVTHTFSSRRGHSSQLSISDPSHHVTEAIGTLYGDEDDSGSDSGRPLSFVPDAYHDHLPRPLRQHSLQGAGSARGRLTRSISDQATISSSSQSQSDGGTLRKSQTLHLPGSSYRQHPNSQHHQLSPTPSLRDVHDDPSGSQFPLTNIDNPNDIAQELSNLQALRRLSMDVGNNIDPDMPPMTFSAIPAIAPSGDDDENDPSRLLWVPARVHPELAPSEFKSFLENRVESIRRRSGEILLLPEGDLGRGQSLSLKRQKSMLSHQIENVNGHGAVGYVDGAERLVRQRSQSNQHELSIEDLVNDPTKVVQKLAQESQLHHSELANPDDMPILPMSPGMGLRRSTRTTYRKGGSLRSGGGSLSKRRGMRQLQENEQGDQNSAEPLDSPPRNHGLTRVQSEPVTENYSRPNRSVRRQQKFSQESPDTLAALEGGTTPGIALTSESQPPLPHQDHLPTRTSSASPTSPPDANLTDPASPVSYQNQSDSQYFQHYPERSSSSTSQGASSSDPRIEQTHTEAVHEASARLAGISNHPQIYINSQQQQYPSKAQAPNNGQTLSEGLAASPSLPGGGNTRTDALTFIPTLSQDDRKFDKKSKKDRDDDSSSFSSKSSGAWKWFKGGNDEKDKKKEESKKSKAKALLADKAQDNARLDVLQTSIDKTSPKSRESLVLDRESFDGKLQEQRKKESNRKSDSKKEKDGNIFSSLFGGSKKKDEKDKGSKKGQFLHVPEEPAPYKPLQPDVDYNWTRFPLLEERAIYRMAHIKLANPRRPLLSQVLLSNFMYSYLAIVQAMHPQMNIPISPQQKRLEEEARQKQQEEEYLAQHAAENEEDGQDIDQYNFDYHRAAVQYTDNNSNEQVEYVDDAQIYEDDHGEERDRHEYEYDPSTNYDKSDKDYYQYHGDDQDRRGDGHNSNVW